MPVEIEAKMKVADHEPVRQRLRDAGAERVGRFLEVNAFFDTEDRSLLAADEGLRVRRETEVDGGEKRFRITYKGPRKQGALKQRDELEFHVSDADAAESLLEHLSFLRVLRFQKRRETWRLDGCEIELDELPHLGTFVEVEGPSEPRVMIVRDKLGLGDQPILKASYVALLISHLQEQGLDARDVTFQ